MKTFQEIVERSRKFDTYKDYLDHYSIIESSVEYEKDFFRRDLLTNYNSIDIYNQTYRHIILERLGYSLSPNFVIDRLIEELGGFIIEDGISILTKNRESNVTIKFKVNNKAFDRRYKKHFREKLNKILHYCNWYIFWDPEDDVKDIKTSFFKIEPTKPENATRFIYDDCKGIIYRLLYNGKYTDKKLDDILKNGLSPKYYQSEFENNLSNSRIYFIANTSKDKIKKDIEVLISSNSDYDNHRQDLKLIKIDLKKFKNIHNKTIECFIDPRMNLKCYEQQNCSILLNKFKIYWTLEFIPPSCIEDVTENILNKIL